MDLETLGKFVALAGVAMLVVGVLLWAGGRLGLGSLPGNLHVSGEGWSCYLPIAASILVSLLLTLVLNLILRFMRR